MRVMRRKNTHSVFTRAARAGVRLTALVLLALAMTGVQESFIYPENVREMDRRADEYYRNKEFSKALAEWLWILEMEPENQAIQKKIEILYEEKHRKDLAFQKARYHYRKAMDVLTEDPEAAQEDSDEAIKNFVIAYRVDPQDPQLQTMREDMRKLQEEVKIELAKQRLSRELKKRYLALMQEADVNMTEGRFEDAVKNYKEVLSFVPEDPAAIEGLRNAELAISNRLRYEKILGLLASGVTLFDGQKYMEARLEFYQVLDLDARNAKARSYLKKIDNILEDKRNYELKRIQAEQFYVSGKDNLARKRFDRATDDFENTLSLIDNYKDTVVLLAGVERLRKEWAEEQKRMRLRNIDREFQNGLIAFADARYKEALSSFEKVLVLDPENALVKKYIVRVKEALRDIEEEEVDENSPYYDLINSLIVSGRDLYEKGDYAGSRLRWDKILRLFPKNRIALEYILKCEIRLNPVAYRALAARLVEDGRDLLRERKYRSAIRKFEIIQSIQPDYPEIAALIAMAKRGLEMPETGGVSPAEIAARYAEGTRLYALGGRENSERALENFRWIVARDPNNARALAGINRIESQMRLGGADVAEERQKLTEKQRQLVRTYYYNGINYYTNNNFDKAIEEWRKVLAIDPTHERARNNIRKCVVLLGR